ncbi:MAG: FMN-dependent NADH-azoreductase [Epulopiscium sp.]|jgi:FMN-dependent NADH-azoreductase|uniref:FMN-dependent NADH-azoreductase n=1 Tax=Defluviitalea raffinosedens TaxID=1450156 RepID=UPI0019580794|nr:FMN-dependent NADH-azoreductase [Defluviitalea raffinosedens]MBM7686196.1 FMN-dependent NADH-azoreductase [Defluviitalea raffinosedens]MDK2789119.1 FMN-dependent NADH-azoreductase [Candidatus Epulonipiscium sp.]
MSKLLYIKVNAKPEGISRTFKISDHFIGAYVQTHPSDEIITLDLYKEGIKFLSAEDIQSIYGHKTEESKKHPVLKYAYQFAEADKYVIAEPMWNLSIPAILKAYIDYITVSGITFNYTEDGPVGLCKGKKAVHITTRGGQYLVELKAAFEMGDRYLRTIFGFFGITDFTTIVAEELDIVGKDVDAIVENAIQKAQELAKTF